MSRHNRRRNRGHKNISILQRSIDSTSSALALPSVDPVNYAVTHTASCGRAVVGASARPRHNRYMTWQISERYQREEAATFEVEKTRLFGEEDGSGEDEVLCVRMLEYFGELDFIDG